MFVGDVFFDKPKLYGRAAEIVGFAEFSLHVAFVTPVQKLCLAAKDFERRDWVIGFLNHVVEFWLAVFEPSWWVLFDDVMQPIVEVFGGKALLSAQVNFVCEIEYFSDVLSGYGAGKNQRCPWHKIE